MNKTILQTLFLDNPELPIEIACFCESLPEYVQAERDYNRAAQELEALIGYEQYSAFEYAMTNHLAFQLRAYYLFGLNLRRELLKGLAG